MWVKERASANEKNIGDLKPNKNLKKGSGNKPKQEREFTKKTRSEKLGVPFGDGKKKDMKKKQITWGDGVQRKEC